MVRTAIWLYFFLFIAFFDLHAQYPILTPFAISLGAAPSFIGLMMGMYSLTHLPGNLLAGYSVDRFGSRLFIVLSLLLAGVIMIVQSHISNPWELLVLRSISGFVLAFLSPACMALLASLSQSHVVQGKLMAGNGLVHTLASVVSPAAGALLVAKIGFAMAFTTLGWVLVVTALLAFFFIKDHATTDRKSGIQPAAIALEVRKPVPELSDEATVGPYTWIVFILPVAISCSQGILFFELPLMDTSEKGIMATGILFSIISIGSLITLSMLFLNRYSAFNRTILGAFFLAITFFGLTIQLPVPLYIPLLLIGITKGVIFPAMSTLLIQLSGRGRYGRMFSVLSIASSIGAFLGPFIAGYVRDSFSPYFIGFVVLMLAVAILPFHAVRRDAYLSRG